MKKILLVSGILVSSVLFAATASATAGPACNGGSFESASTGSVNGQGGWVITNSSFDQAVVANTYGYAELGCKTLRISDAFASGSFGDQLFSPSATNEAGETDALNGGMSSGTRTNHFEAQFDIASTMTTEQAGMHLTVSPDRGDGARMSYLRFDDSAEGINVFFYDVQGMLTDEEGCTVESPCANFTESEIATLSRSSVHTVRFVMDFVDGSSNDVVKIYIDGNLVHTGTSWEDYYRFDPESNPSVLTESPVSNSRTVDSLLFRISGTANPGNASNGFLIDNLTPPSTFNHVPVASNQSVSANEDTQTTITLGGVDADGNTLTFATTSSPMHGTLSGTYPALVYTPDLNYYGSDSFDFKVNDGTADSATSATVSITVNSVNDNPTISLINRSEYFIAQNSTYVEPGTMVSDVEDDEEDLTVTTEGSVNTSVVGVYTLTYTVTDTDEGSASVQRNVHIYGQAGGTGSGNGIVGCRDPRATNYNANATYDGAVCTYAPVGEVLGASTSTVPTTGGASTSTPATTVGTSTTTGGQVLGATAYAFTRNLGFGSRGDDVTELQKILIAQGYLVLDAPTKYFGPLTRAALKLWQAKNGIPSTGFFGPLSRAFLAK